MKKKILELITGVLLIIITGTFWGTWFSLSRTMYHFPPDYFINIGKEIIRNIAIPMSIIMPLSLAGLLLLLIFSWKNRNAYHLCLFVTFLLFIITLLITVIVEVPIDNQLRTWTISTLPSDWVQIREKWELWHSLRTLTSVSGMSFYLIALMNKHA